MKTARIISSKASSRVASMSTADLKSHLSSIIMSLGVAGDLWLYHDASPADVQISLDALNAVWSELERREGEGASSFVDTYTS